MRQLQLNSETKQDILQNLLKRSPNHYTEYESRVAEMIAEVREKKDEAVFRYTNAPCRYPESKRKYSYLP